MKREIKGFVMGVIVTSIIITVNCITFAEYKPKIIEVITDSISLKINCKPIEMESFYIMILHMYL